MTQRFDQIRRATIVSAVTNFLLAVIKMIIGTIGLSPAVFADGVHSLSDLLGDGLVYIAAKYASQGPDEEHPYGHKRFETFATLGLGVFLVIVGVGIGYDAVKYHIVEAQTIPDTYTVWAAVISIIANEWLFRYMRGIARRLDSDMLRANAYHNRADALTSIIVLVGLLGSFAGWPVLDGVAALIVAIFIIRMGVKWSWKAFDELAEAGVAPELNQKIKKMILAQPGVVSTHMLRTRRMAGEVFLDVHILIDPYTSASEGHLIAESVRVALANAFDTVEDITVHVDTEDHPHTLPQHLPPSRKVLLDELMPQWEKLVPKKAIQHITLHYIKGKIEMILTLDLSVLKNQKSAEKLTGQFQKTIHKNKQIRSLTINFKA